MEATVLFLRARPFTPEWAGKHGLRPGPEESCLERESQNRRERMATNDMHDPTDGELASDAQAGDSHAFELLVRRYYRSVTALVAAHGLHSDDVEDAVQDSFLRALERIRMFDPRRPFAPWLYQVSRNVARNFRRKSARQRGTALASIEDVAESTAPGPAGEFQRAEVHRIVEAAIGRLPRRQRTALRLFDIEDYSAAEVGQMMGLNAAAVRSNVYHARRALRSQLTEQLREGSRE